MVSAAPQAELSDREMADVLFRDMRLRGRGLDEAWTAFNESPSGTVAVALRSFGVEVPPGERFLCLIREGQHTLPQGRRTGWRFVRGSHSGSYVRDPRGTDRLPEGHET